MFFVLKPMPKIDVYNVNLYFDNANAAIELTKRVSKVARISSGLGAAAR